MLTSVLKWLQAVLAGLAVVVGHYLGGLVAGGSDPVMLAITGLIAAAATKLAGWLLSKVPTGSAPPSA